MSGLETDNNWNSHIKQGGGVQLFWLAVKVDSFMVIKAYDQP